MATAERFEKPVERTVVENVPVIRLELTIEEAQTLRCLCALHVDGSSVNTYGCHAESMLEAIAPFTRNAFDVPKRFVGSLTAQPLPEEPA